ncbi:hypothetical protein RRG08_008774 [Elysia crispata]|uniref:Uncharacterized protein n=1 Tax=Elysia crispata TaxID=231223 RepID=A0AAE0YNZ6_9GAST|nr:hypothetical protein RRG08_008774 [Elysia crispata]
MVFIQSAIGALALLGLGNLLHIIGLATPEWVIATPKNSYGTKLSAGLWEVCIQDICVKIPDLEDWLNACRAMAILGMIAGIGAAAMEIVSIVMFVMCKKSFKPHGPISLSTAILSSIMIIICVILYALNSEFDDTEEKESFGYSFALSIVGAIFILLGGGTAMAGSASSE